MEYLCYAGGNLSMWTDNEIYFNRNCPGKVFGKPCLVLKGVCWMDPWGIIEGVTIPKKSTDLTLCIYHHYGEYFYMNDCQIKIEFSEYNEGYSFN
jgi:hypothetical protein